MRTQFAVDRRHVRIAAALGGVAALVLVVMNVITYEERQGPTRGFPWTYWILMDLDPGDYWDPVALLKDLALILLAGLGPLGLVFAQGWRL